jgi:CBS domain-containing protein
MSEDIIEEEELVAQEREFEEARLAMAGLQRPIRELPTRHAAVICEQSTTVRQAIEAMQRERTGCVLVVDQSHLVGIFTERDVLTKVAARSLDLDRLQVGELMTPKPECLDMDTELAYALNQMSVGGYRHIPLLDDDGRPTGVISMQGIVDYFVALFPREVLNLPPSPPHGIPQDREGA